MRLKSQGSIQQPDDSPLNLRRYLNLPGAVLISLFLLVNTIILISGGIRLGGDSQRYLGGAENLLRGVPLQGRQVSYSGYALLIAFCRLTGTGLPGVLFTQLVLAAAACAALYDLGRRLHSRRAGLIAAGLFAANPDIARWHAFILTDSLYISLVILSVWCVHTAAERKRRWYLLAALPLTFAALVRPNGLCLIGVALVYLVSRAISRHGLRWLAISGIVLALIAGAILASRAYPAGSRDHPEMTLRKGVTGITPWRVPMPPAPAPLEAKWSDAAGYLTRHPLASFRLGVIRVSIELIHIRPYYSFRHNLILLLTLPLLYLLALMGLRLNRNRSLRNLVVLAITSHLLVVAFTIADGDGRFLLYILPLVCLLSACAAASLLERYLSRRESEEMREMGIASAQLVGE